jgi:hypothetical protein
MARFPLISVLLTSMTMVAGCHHDLTRRDSLDSGVGKPVISGLQNREAIAKLLPAEVRLDTIAECEHGGFNKITVEDELIRVKAHVAEDGTLKDESDKPIEFFRLTGCWGNPPINVQQIADEQNRRLEELRKTHTVITLTCNPRGENIP